LRTDGFEVPAGGRAEICRFLVDLLDEKDGQREASRGPELVTGRGSSGSGGANMPTLEECGVDLTQMAMDGLLDPVTGRDDEIRSCLRTLLRRRKNNVCLLGDPGVGKVRNRRSGSSEKTARSEKEKKKKNNGWMIRIG